ncbi:nuclear transport factor 2 family protein [Caballeronia sp. GAWG2-1]|uniref:nuclear transport factor 2 family protein n=1 Tax=Caballeronia sp. GAWG2-1 TaxID=2921744 RepID=UPI0020297912|nr:nuclear transport factor 2 family protein [Caballeronia sp. GAWG2-1]
MSESTRIYQIIDQSAIEDVIETYFRAADSCDRDLMKTCFVSDVRAKYDGRPEVEDVDELIEQIPLFANLESGVCRICTHLVGSIRTSFTSDSAADVETVAIAFLVGVEGNADMRGLRYIDKFEKTTDKGWKIAERSHILDWSCRAPVTLAANFSTQPRVSGRVGRCIQEL